MTVKTNIMEKLIIKNFIKNINSRFDLILTAAKIARQLQTEDNKTILKPNHKHKCTTLALKEIEEYLDSKKSLIL